MNPWLDKTYVAFLIKSGVAIRDKDFDLVQKMYAWYGSYLELVGTPRPALEVTSLVAVSIPHRPLFKMEVCDDH